MSKVFMSRISFSTSSIILLSFSSIFSQNLTNHFVTTNNGWFIASPIIGQETPKNEDAQDHMKFLHNLGEKADELWLRTQNKAELITHLHETFKAIDRNFLNKTIDQIAQNNELLESITEKSYRNVTGFLKIVLAEGGKNSWKLRLHVWQEQEEKEFPHNHKWDFYSKIISGYLLQETYKKADAVCSLQAYPSSNRYSVREPVSLMPILSNGEMPCPCRDDYVLDAKKTSSETVSLDLQSQDRIALGESYLMPYHLIHAINPGRGAISLVFTSRNTTDNSEVFVPLNMLETDLRRHASSFTKDTCMQELLRAQQLINQLQIHPTYLPEVVDQNHHYKNSIPEHLNWRRGIVENPSQKTVVQLSKLVMQKFIVTANGESKLLVGGNKVDSTNDYLFVLFDGTMYASGKDFAQQSNELICHSSFTDYGPVQSAGVLCFDDQGDLINIEAYSGHYKPSVADMEIAKKYLNTIGVNTQQAVLCAYQDRL